LKLLLELDKPEPVKIRKRLPPVYTQNLQPQPVSDELYSPFSTNFGIITIYKSIPPNYVFDWQVLSTSQLNEIYQYHLGGTAVVAKQELITLLVQELPNYKRDICKYHATKGCLYKDKSWLCSRNHEL